MASRTSRRGFRKGQLLKQCPRCPKAEQRPTLRISKEGKQSRKAPLLFSTQGWKKAPSEQHRTKKGQLFGSGLQLCASGAPAEPESMTPSTDQRHPHSQRSSTEEGETIGAKKKGRRRQNMFYNSELGSCPLQRAGCDSGTRPRTFHKWLPGETTSNSARTLLPFIRLFASRTLGFSDYALRFQCCREMYAFVRSEKALFTTLHN